MALGHKNHIQGDSVSIADATIANLTASKPVFSDATKKLVSTGTVPVNQGGTGAATLADGGLVVGNVTGAVEVVVAGAATEILVGGGANTKPAWGTDIPTAVTIGGAAITRVGGTDVAVADGGTNISTYAVGDLLYASTTGVLSKLADVATGQYLASGGVNTAPAYATLNQAAVAGLTTGSSPAFAGVSLGTGELTAGSINRASGSLTLEIGDAAQITATNALVTVAHDLCINETAYFDAVQTATGDGTTTIDWGLGNKFVFTHGAMNETFTFTSPGGPCSLTLVMIQDGAGSRTSTWPGTVKWPSNGTAPTQSTGAADVDIVTFFWDGTSYYGQAALDFA